MTLEEIKEIAETWFEWPEERTDYVTYTSCLLFAREMYERGQAEQEKYQELIAAAEAVIARLEMPQWKDVEPTAEVIYRMRDVIERIKEEAE